MTTPFDFTHLLGEVLHSKNNAEIATATLGTNGKQFVALYFTASWCPPCRRFTPDLIKYYKLAHIQEKLDIVVVSSDREEVAHDGYFAKMPWLSLPYVDRDRKKSLSEKYGVKFIPTLILLDAFKGEVLIRDFKSVVEKDLQGHHFPYPEKSIRSVLAQATTVAPHESFKGKYLAIYFDALTFLPQLWGKCNQCENDFSRGTRYQCEQCAWFNVCESCHETIADKHDKEHTFKTHPAPDLLAESLVTRAALLKAYNEAKANGDAFEVIQVSWEKTVDAHATHAEQVPWPVVAFDNKFETGFHLSRLLNVEPNTTAVIIIDQARNVINKEGGLAFKKGIKFPFAAPNVVDIDDSTVSNNFGLYEKPSVVVYLESVTDAEDIEKYEALVQTVANKFSPAAGQIACTDESCEVASGAEPEVIFFTAKSADNAGSWLRTDAGFTNESTKPEAILFDFNGGRLAFPLRAELNEESLVQFVEDFKSGKLKELKDQELAEAQAKAESEKVAAAATTSVSEVKTWTKTTKTTTTTVSSSLNGTMRTTTTVVSVYKLNV
ncbi:hypothetical protein HDU79_003075 [Rhizoclosmatium sp. JEL0117]|nr:hypothetical protein HDU79_003075 [Rhizoclosmatium sp. JEL0117]